ncbi:hypothetical protein, partial [Laceyella sediminis]|uniref:hypothetical protein n=1 Tax=Laceyella sediminis TaxID=573074 RepID=UPI001C629F32
AMLLSRAGKGGGFKFIWVDIHPLIVYIPFIYKNPAINKVDSQGLSTFSSTSLGAFFCVLCNNWGLMLSLSSTCLISL